MAHSIRHQDSQSAGSLSGFPAVLPVLGDDKSFGRGKEPSEELFLFQVQVPEAGNGKTGVLETEHSGVDGSDSLLPDQADQS